MDLSRLGGYDWCAQGCHKLGRWTVGRSPRRLDANRERAALLFEAAASASTRTYRPPCGVTRAGRGRTTLSAQACTANLCSEPSRMPVLVLPRSEIGSRWAWSRSRCCASGVGTSMSQRRRGETNCLARGNCSFHQRADQRPPRATSGRHRGETDGHTDVANLMLRQPLAEHPLGEAEYASPSHASGVDCLSKCG